MPSKSCRNKVTDILRAVGVRAVVGWRSGAEPQLPDWIRRDIGLADGQAEHNERRTKWRALNM